MNEKKCFFKKIFCFDVADFVQCCRKLGGPLLLLISAYVYFAHLQNLGAWMGGGCQQGPHGPLFATVLIVPTPLPAFCEQSH